MLIGAATRQLRRVKRADRSWALSGSIALHAVMLAVIFSPASHYPLTINNHTPTVLWLSTASLSLCNEGEAVPHNDLPEATAAQQEARDSTSELHYHVKADGSPRPEVAEIVPATPALSTEAVTVVAAVILVKKTGEAVRVSPPLPALLPQAVPPLVADSHPPLPRAAPLHHTLMPVPASASVKIISAEVKAKPLPQKTIAAVQPTGYMMSLKGDLKVVIRGLVSPDATILFTAFPLSHRGNPLSRSESRKSIKIVPVVAKVREDIHEVVIPQTNPGIYTIIVDPANSRAHVTFSLKLYEGTSKAVTKNMGTRTLAGTKVLLKILMPEGILWEDDTAFTGNMEDSDGVTKFNTDSGLMWKEYSEL